MKKRVEKFLKSQYLDKLPQLYKSRTFSPIREFEWKDLGVKNLESELLLLDLLLKPNDVFFDIGSNVGQYLYKSERILSPENIHGFEPNPELFANLKKLFPKITLRNIAFSNKNGTAEFKVPNLECQSNVHTRGTLNINFVDPEEKDHRIMKVRTMKLDDLCRQENINKLDLIKIDVEGHELSVLEGAVETMKNLRPSMIVEIEQRHHDRALHEIIAGISTDIYDAFYFDLAEKTLLPFNPGKAPGELQDLEKHALSKEYINNFIFIPRQNAGRVVDLNAEIRKKLKAV